MHPTQYYIKNAKKIQEITEVKQNFSVLVVFKANRKGLTGEKRSDTLKKESRMV